MNKLYYWLCGSVILLFVFSGFVTINDYGMGWDEITRWNSGDAKLKYYQIVLSPEKELGDFRLVGDRYPGLFDLPLAAIHAAMGGNRMIMGHGLSILFGALGLVSTAWLANLLFGCRVAFFSTLFLAVFPRFYGHAMINPKDIPFLAAYTLGLAGIFWIAKKILQDEKVPIGTFLVSGIFIGMAGSARIPGLVLFGIAIICWCSALLWKNKVKGQPLVNRKELFPLMTGILTTGAFSFLLVLLFFPRAHSEIFTSLPAVAGQLHTSANTLPLLFNGEIMDANDAPFAYAIRFFIISCPIWMLFLLGVGLASLAHWIYSNRSTKDPHFLLRLLFLLSAIFPWAYVVVFRPAIHDGLRHILFAVPPLIIIMGFGMEDLINRVREKAPQWKLAAPIILALLIVLQIIHLVRMHPYQYVSYNFLAGAKETIPNRYDAEYWCTSTRHLLEALPKIAGTPRPGDGPLKVRVSGAIDSAIWFVPDGYQLVNNFGEADYYVSNTNFRIDTIVDGEELYKITRGGIPIGVIKKLEKD